MNGDDRMGEGAEGQGTDVGQGGGLVLVLVATRSSGDFVEQPGRTPTRTSTRPPHPLHPAPCPYRTRDASSKERRSERHRSLSTTRRIVETFIEHSWMLIHHFILEEERHAYYQRGQPGDVDQRL